MILKLIRVILVGWWGAICSLIAFGVSLTRPFHPNNSYVFSRLFGPLAAKILGIKYVFKGRQQMILHSPCIFVSNHQHNLDLVTGCVSVPPRTVSLGKKDLKLIPFFGQFYWLAGNILIDRHHRQRALEAMDKVKHAIREKNTSIWIMPEGTRNRTGVLKPFKKGAFVTAIHAQVPIVPVAVSTYSRTIDLGRWRAGTVVVEALPPLSTEGLGMEAAETLAQQARESIRQKIIELDREALSDQHT